MARPCTENRAPSSSCVDRAGLGLPVSPELMETGLARHHLTNRDREVIESTKSRVKIISKLTNFKIKSRIEGYIGK